MRNMLLRLYGPVPLTGKRAIEGKLEFQKNSKDLSERISRIPDSTDGSSSSSATSEATNNEIRLHRYARHLLSAHIDRYWSKEMLGSSRQSANG